VRRYLTESPEVEASVKLLELVNGITHMCGSEFEAKLSAWHAEYRNVLDERGHDKRLKSPPYMRPRLRSAYLSKKKEYEMALDIRVLQGQDNTENKQRNLRDIRRYKVKNEGSQRDQRRAQEETD